MNIDFEFHFEQMKFMRSRILDVSLHKGVCLSMCIDFIDRRRKQLPCDFLYFSQLYKFASYQRAVSYGVEAGKIQDAVLFPNGRFLIGDRKPAYLFREACQEYEFTPEELPDGDFIINIVYYTQNCHVIALRKNKCGIEVFNPSEGLFKSEDVNTLNVYLQERNKKVCQYIHIYRCQ
ncbi:MULTISPECIES: hypothetical protein [Escherichia]|uniref:hypothetical protein n=1 Tax=Escherichia TaxID=561 RepID=UPI00257050C5|nr:MULTISPECIES: hypothetical protein [Escherichia]MEC9876111.1 hypothetical protein [Escherichia ruysiae]MEC9885720.1 hypothetical protein [Escherichia ruysiae]MED9038693.1 hypothetical protein [Escherichia ruysiae]MED9475426.1 hypothetical protein [Escherichia ruysiae]